MIFMKSARMQEMSFKLCSFTFDTLYCTEG